MRTPYVVIVALLAILVPVGFATEKDAGSRAATPVATIAKRVETLRGLRYHALPRPQRVTVRQATRDGLADLDTGYPQRARRADEALYTLLGLLPAGADLRDISGSIFGSQVAGYYDPRSQRLKIVDGTATANRVLDEMVIAHELTHALEDQAIGIDLAASERSDDAGYAYTALVEGTATDVMYAYLGRHFKPEFALGGLLGGSLASGSGTGELPPFVLQGLLFPYQAGQPFVEELYRRGGRSWTLVDLAERTRPPTTTEQILHPDKWIDAEATLPVRLGAPGAGWHRLTGGTFGEWQTGQLLALAGRADPDAAAGWGGDRYALYRRGTGACSTPCAGRDALVLRWRFDTPGDLGEFVPALRAALRERRAGGKEAVAVAGGRVTLAVAPDRATAQALSRA